jgi:NRAMP (natural resistance-associated macrophage protein)-like metal ion transporter
MPELTKPDTTPPNGKKESFWDRLGPGIITGAADDDPSGIATYSQAGALLGTHVLWSMVVTWPLMSAIQIVSAQIGRVTGRGLAANLQKFYGSKLALPIISLLVLSNIFNLGADINAMGAACELMFGLDARVMAVLLTVVTVVLQIVVPYRRYVSVLKWLTFALFTYIGVAFFVRMPWREVAIGTLIPHFEWSKSYVTTFVAVLGTTISPYLFFWQSSQEVEEIRAHKDEHALKTHAEEAPWALRRLRRDTLTGMGFSNIVAYFIMLATAATLHAHGITTIETAAQAAEALRPIAGSLCFALFSIGIIGTGLLAIPVLAGSAAFAVGEALHFRASLEAKPMKAKRFYGVLAAATFAGLLMMFVKLSPMQALYWAAVINGLISAPVMIVIMIMASRRKIMGEFTIAPTTKILGWIATAVMVGVVILFFTEL